MNAKMDAMCVVKLFGKVSHVERLLKRLDGQTMTSSLCCVLACHWLFSG